jgi:phosphatidylinositol glycan class M
MKVSTIVYFFAAFAVRLMVVYIGCLIDSVGGAIKYTDADYEVFTDAASHV